MTEIIKGRKKGGMATVLYGTPGVGKSTLAAGAQNALFIGPEENAEMDIDRFPLVKTYAGLMKYLVELAQGKYKYKTLVLDSISGMERIIHNEICANEPGKSMSTALGGYGKAYDEAARRLWTIREALELVREKTQMNIIVIGHSVKTKLIDPILQTEYDVYDMSLHKNARRDCNSFFTEWASLVLFVNWATYKPSDDKFAGAHGKRELLTEYRPSHLAKNRFGLPYKIELADKNGWDILQKHIDNFYAGGKKEKPSSAELQFLIKAFKDCFVQIKDESIKPTIQKRYNDCMAVADKDLAKGIEALDKTCKRMQEIISNQ